MTNEPGKRLIILLSFCVSILCFFLNLFSGGDILYAAFAAVCVMLVSSLILLQIAKAIVMIMAHYLRTENELAHQSEVENQNLNVKNQ